MKITDITGRDQIPLYLNENGLIGTGAEIGVSRGRHAHRILKTWNGKMLLLVDAWRKYPEKQDETRKRLKIYKDRCKVIHKPSIEAAKEISNESLDFCFIDVGHSYEAVKEDINAWWPKMRKGGLFCGHDYSINEDIWLANLLYPSPSHPRLKVFPPQYRGVQLAVDEFVAAENLVVHIDVESNQKKLKRHNSPTSWYIVNT